MKMNPNNRVPRRRELGFSLVEIMVVLVIIGLMSGMVVMTLPKRKPPLDGQMQELTRQINAIASEALISGSVMAAGFSTNGYVFYRYGQGEWSIIMKSEWINIPKITLQKTGVTLPLTEQVVPMLLFEPTGLSSVFTLTCIGKGGQYALFSKGDGKVTLQRTPL